MQVRIVLATLGVPITCLAACSTGNSSSIRVPSTGQVKSLQCNPPANEQVSGLCASWVAANAGQDAAFWAKGSFFLAVFGTIGVGATIVYSARSTKAAVDSLHAGRAWIVVSPEWEFARFEDATVEGLGVMRRGMLIKPYLKNVGNTPALKCGVTRSYKLVDAREDISDFTARHTSDHVMTVVVPQGGTFFPNDVLLDESELPDWISHKKKLIYAVRIRYFDVFTAKQRNPPPRETYAAFVLTPFHELDARTGEGKDKLKIEPLGNVAVLT